MKKNKVSIIVPVYNCEKLLSRCVDSLLNQTYKNIEIILIDDGSSDDSGRICDEYKAKESKVRVFHKENGGVSSARNLGLEKMVGNYFLFVDSDDYLDLNSIEVMVSSLKSNNQIIGLCYKEILDGNVVYKKNKVIYSINELIFSILSDETPGCCWGLLYNSDLQRKNKIFFDLETSYMEDTLFLVNYLIVCKINKICFIDSSFYNYYINPASLTHSNITLNTLKGYYYSLDKINELSNCIYNEFILNDKIFLLESCCTNINDYKKRLKLIEFFKKNISVFKYTGDKFKLKIFIYIIKKDNYSIYVNKYFTLKNFLKKLLRR